MPELATLTGTRAPTDGFVGVRPEAVYVRPSGQAPIAAQVDLVEALGADTLIHATAHGVPIVARQSERTTLVAGEPVGLAVDPGALHFFDREGRVLI